MTGQEYHELKEEMPELQLPHLSELLATLWVEVTNVLPKRTREEMIAETLTFQLRRTEKTPNLSERIQPNQRHILGVDAEGKPIYATYVYSHLVLESLIERHK